jgi:hypothetical protein
MRRFFAFAVTFMVVSMPGLGYAQTDSVEHIQEFTGDAAFNLNGIGRMNVEDGMTIYSFGELDCIFGVTQMAGAGSTVTRAKCSLVDGLPSEFNVDQIKQKELSQTERLIMYLVRKSVAVGVDYVPLDFRKGYGAQNWRLHVHSIKCSGPTSSSWKEFKCAVKTVYTSAEKAIR